MLKIGAQKFFFEREEEIHHMFAQLAREMEVSRELRERARERERENKPRCFRCHLLNSAPYTPSLFIIHPREHMQYFKQDPSVDKILNGDVQGLQELLEKDGNLLTKFVVCDGTMFESYLEWGN